jgi:HD-GYP domain-containing protein (c-di-GMP phosphodiesterase class II)
VSGAPQASNGLPAVTRGRNEPRPAAGEHAHHHRAAAVVVVLVWCALGLATAVAVAMEGASDTLAAVLVAVAIAGGALGWFLAERARVALEDDNDERTADLERALSELEVAQAETVRRLSMAVEFRDEDTGQHIERIGRFSTLLAEQIGMDHEFCERIRHAAPLHDVGKVAIPDAILLKPGPLTPDERKIVETHAEEGYRLVRGSTSAILDMAATIALSHQEKWDGSGYPRGLKGEAIPIEGRIVAVADVFDALTSDRVYRPAFPLEKAIEMMREERGTHFDPVLLDAFMEVLERNGSEGRTEPRDPEALVEQTLEKFVAALGRGNAENAEEAISAAIEAGVTPTMLHAEVIGPSLRRVSVLRASGQLDAEGEQLAMSIIKRVLATLGRYMTAATAPTRQRVLLASVEGDNHTLGLQMVGDQLAAAGFRTIFDTGVAPEGLLERVETEAPDVLVVGEVLPAFEGSVEIALRDLRSHHPEIPIVLGGPAVGGALPPELEGINVLERIDESVPAVEDLLAATAHTA